MLPQSTVIMSSATTEVNPFDAIGDQMFRRQPAALVADGLTYFSDTTDAGCPHQHTVVDRPKPKDLPEFQWPAPVLDPSIHHHAHNCSAHIASRTQAPPGAASLGSSASRHAFKPNLLLHGLGKQSFPAMDAQAEPGCQNTIKAIPDGLNSYVSRNYSGDRSNMANLLYRLQDK